LAEKFSSGGMSLKLSTEPIKEGRPGNEADREGKGPDKAMKNKEKPRQKQKEFSSDPFKGLKGAALELRGTAAAPPPTPKKPEKIAIDADDESLFWNAVADVRQLHTRSSTAAKVKEQVVAKVQRDEEEQRFFLQALDALKMDVRFDDELSDEDAASQRPTPVNRLRQLRRGGIRIDLQLDLHGLTRDEALENLERFVKGAYSRGQKGVLVITGKGNNSPGEPVLKLAVASWLRESGKSMISEFVQAPKEMGGSGAFVIFFKEKKEPAAPEG